MNRSDFLKIVSATPFAIKTLIFSGEKEHVVNEVKKELHKSLNKNYILFKIDGKEFAVSNIGSLRVERDGLYGDYYTENVHIEFSNMVCSEGYLMDEIIQNRTIFTIEYYMGSHETFYTGEGYLTEIEQTFPAELYSGVVQMKNMRTEFT